MENLDEIVEKFSAMLATETFYADDQLSEALVICTAMIRESHGKQIVSDRMPSAISECIRLLGDYTVHTSTSESTDPGIWTIELTNTGIEKTHHFRCFKSTAEIQLEFILSLQNSFLYGMWSDSANESALHFSFSDSDGATRLVLHDGLKEISTPADLKALNINIMQETEMDYQDFPVESALSMQSMIGSLSSIALPGIGNLVHKITEQVRTEVNAATIDKKTNPVAEPEPFAHPEPVEARKSERQPKFCSNCGSPLKPGVKFCGNCGHKAL